VRLWVQDTLGVCSNLPIGKKLRWDFFCALCGVYAENKTIPLSVVLTPFKFALVLVLKIDV
jgi:hypothetical protein